MKEQQNNKRNNIVISINNETKTLAQWSEKSGIVRTTISQRLKSGMKNEELLSIPKHNENKSNEKGIYWHTQSSKWRVDIKRKYIGSAYSLEEAIEIKNKYLHTRSDDVIE